MKTVGEYEKELHLLYRNLGREPAFPYFKQLMQEHDRQLCEAIEREVIGFTELMEPNRPGHNIDIGARNGLRAEQRAKLRAFCGVGEQSSAVDDDWVDQQIERSEES